MSEEEEYVGYIVFFFVSKNSHSRLDRPKITSSGDKKNSIWRGLGESNWSIVTLILNIDACNLNISILIIIMKIFMAITREKKICNNWFSCLPHKHMCYDKITFINVQIEIKNNATDTSCSFFMQTNHRFNSTGERYFKLNMSTLNPFLKSSCIQ